MVSVTSHNTGLVRSPAHPDPKLENKLPHLRQFLLNRPTDAEDKNVHTVYTENPWSFAMHRHYSTKSQLETSSSPTCFD